MRINSKIGILGFGEVGQAIAKFYKHPLIKDLNRDDGLKGADVLHVCIPYDKNFLKAVGKEIKELKPKLTVIHSTVAPGATAKLIKQTKNKMIVHSPVRGVHPYLYEGIKTFLKFIGAENKTAAEAAKKHLSSLGIKTKIVYPAKTSEALKLWDTAQFGWMIVLNKEIKKWCDKNGLDFDIVYTEANKSYNQGYLKLNKPRVVRPYLKYMPGKIGGHCVIPNCHLLNDGIAKFILKQNRTYENSRHPRRA